ncbi:hypothetical protein GCM10022224_078140 [Nonomuraea antimicrobica]|uniref:Bacteriocin (Lactococcin_972) n=1 Tax=Nonomuraea antimicrobica TaxID=561173 RepID=A0ABP7D9M2_9ACTN
MTFSRELARRVAIAAFAATAALTAVPTAAHAVAQSSGTAASGSSALSILSQHGYVHDGYNIWGGVYPEFSGHRGWTGENGGVIVPSEGILATCKRWGADGNWWYWVKFDYDGLTGHVPGYATNITHSLLPKCSSS